VNKLQWKTKRIEARKQERERKKAIAALRKANQFVAIEMFRAIPDPEFSVTKAEIDLYLREALISNVASTELRLLSRAWRLRAVP
jgi:hypothetical protein